MTRGAAVLLGDCLTAMATLDAASVDAVVTDPPYGLAFMGKQWDHGVPGAPFWTEALRLSKPGAHLLAFGGPRTFHRLTCAIEDAGWEIRDCLSWLYGSGFPKSHNGAWGGTALKPAWEPIILARKPLAGTVAANWGTHGTGALNIDGCRISTGDDLNGGAYSGGERRRAEYRSSDTEAGAVPLSRLRRGVGDYVPPNGRWPANVVLDEDAAALLDAQSGDAGASGQASGPSLRDPYPEGRAFGARVGTDLPAPFYADRGGASRFLYTAKASRSEREAMEVGNGHKLPHSNHPTVKPLDLMRWLVRLITPPNGLILDPFCGSGTTGCAALSEGFRFIGIEREAEYVAIAEARLNATQPSLPLAPPSPLPSGEAGR